MKPIKGWVVIDPDGEILYGTFRKVKMKSIIIAENEKFRSILPLQANEWKRLYNRGYRCIRVTLRSD